MKLPPLEPLDIEILDPSYHDLTLDLPSITAADVSVAVREFSSRLSELCLVSALDDPKLFSDLMGRALLVVAGKVVNEPESVFAPLRRPEFEPWSVRRVRLLAPSPAKAQANVAELESQLRSIRATDGDIDRLLRLATVAAIGSLATIGRLPMQELPDSESYN